MADRASMTGSIWSRFSVERGAASPSMSSRISKMSVASPSSRSAPDTRASSRGGAGAAVQLSQRSAQGLPTDPQVVGEFDLAEVRPWIDLTVENSQGKPLSNRIGCQGPLAEWGSESAHCLPSHHPSEPDNLAIRPMSIVLHVGQLSHLSTFMSYSDAYANTAGVPPVCQKRTGAVGGSAARRS